MSSLQIFGYHYAFRGRVFYGDFLKDLRLHDYPEPRLVLCKIHPNRLGERFRAAGYFLPMAFVFLMRHNGLVVARAIILKLHFSGF
jgi:hypothetical protein